MWYRWLQRGTWLSTMASMVLWLKIAILQCVHSAWDTHSTSSMVRCMRRVLLPLWTLFSNANAGSRVFCWWCIQRVYRWNTNLSYVWVYIRGSRCPWRLQISFLLVSILSHVHNFLTFSVHSLHLSISTCIFLVWLNPFHCTASELQSLFCVLLGLFAQYQLMSL